MQTLGLSEGQKRSDGRLKSLFWPTIENAWDVDYLGQQGFWICLVIGLVNVAVFLISASGMPTTKASMIILGIGSVVFFVHWVGGMGVREHSFSAAVAVFTTYVLNQFASGRIGVLQLIIAAVLLSNVRATYLASHWKPAAEGEDTPMRFSETWRDKLVDQFPKKLWPILKIPFFISVALVLLVLVYGSVVAKANRQARPLADDNSVPSDVVVAPPDSH